MNFGPWSPLHAASLPPGPGVLQVRREHGLVVYPRGKSAMVCYAAAEDLQAAARALAAAHPEAAWLVRCNREPVADPQDRMERVRLLADLPEKDRPMVRVIDPAGPWFKAEIARLRAEKGADFSACDVNIPVEVK